MKARIVVTLTAEIDSPYYPGEDAGAAKGNIAALINHHLAVGSINLLFEGKESDNPRRWAEADLAKLLVRDMGIQVTALHDPE